MDRQIQTWTIAGACVILMFLLACGQIAPRTTIIDTPASTDSAYLTGDPDGTSPPPLSASTSISQPLLDSTPVPSSTFVPQYGFIQFWYVSKLSHKECVTNLPFLAREENGQTILSGGGDVNCVASADNATAEIHGSLDLKGTVSTPDGKYPQGHLVVHLKGTWTEEVAVEPGPDIPLVLIGDIDIPVDFNYLDGTQGFTDVPFNAEDYAFVLFLGHLISEAE